LTTSYETRVDAGLKVEPGEEAKSSLGLPADSIVILYLGRLTPEYKADLEPLIHAFQRTSAAHPSCRLLIAGSEGSSGYANTLMSYAAEMSCAQQVRIIPNFPRFLKPILLGACDIFVSPVDNVQESIGINILEAMAAGRPVVASDWSGYRDLVAHGETGFLTDTAVCRAGFRAGSAIAATAVVPHAERHLAAWTYVDVPQLASHLTALAASPELRRRMGAAGRARVAEHYAWSKVIRQFGDLWQSQIEAVRCGLTDGYHLDVARLFEDYPNRHWQLERLLVRSSRFSAVTAGRHYGADDPRTAILRRCQDAPVPVRGLLTFAGAGAAVFRLLKSGWLEVIAQ
jgi:glycosyltransferase involved in cell wall biosynthesis